MHCIFHLFRAVHESLALFDAPFSAEQVETLRARRSRCCVKGAGRPEIALRLPGRCVRIDDELRFMLELVRIRRSGRLCRLLHVDV
jgi:hypothetical protein